MIKVMVSQWSHLVGALLSLPCLLLIILIYCLGFSFIRMPQKSKHSLINILLLITSTITLFTVSLTLPSSSSSGNHVGYHCLISSTLVNFSTLSCLLWMLLSAFSMYQSLTHSAHEISLTINSTSTSSSSNNNNCTKSSTTDDNNEEDEDEIEPEPNHEDDDDDEDDNLKIPPDLPLQSRSQYHHNHNHNHNHHHHHHQYHPSTTLSSGILSGSGKKSNASSMVTICSYYLFAYGLSTLICIACLLINNNNYNNQPNNTIGSTIYSSTTLQPPWNLLTSPPPSLSSCYHVTLMTLTGYAITYGPIALFFCLNLIVYLIVACILTCLGTNIVSPKGSTLHSHHRYHAAHDDHESSIKPHGLTHTDGNQSIKVDLEWTYRRQLFAQIGLFILFTNLIVSMIFLVSWRPFSFVNHHHHHLNLSTSTTHSSFPTAEASISSEKINASIISSSPTTTPTSNSYISNLTESIPLLLLNNNSISYLIPLPSAASSSSSTSSTTRHSSYLPSSSSSSSSSTNINAFQMDQLFYGLIYSLSSFLIASYLMILYVARRSDVRTLLTYWFKGSNGNRRAHNQYNQYTNHRINNNNGNNGSEVNRGSNWFCCCFSDSVREIPLMPKVDVIRSSNSHSSQSTDHHLFSTTTNYHHHLAQALLQSAHETSTLTSSSSLVNAKLLLNNIDDTATINGKELAHGLLYEEIKSTNNDSLINLNNSSRIASIHSINKSNNSKLINNISSNCQSKQQIHHHHHQQQQQHQQPSLIESTSSTPLITIDSNNGSSSQVNYHLNYHEANHEVFINPKLNAIAKKFFEKNRRKQQQQLTNYDNDKNNLDTKDIQSITRSTSSFKSDHHHPLTTSIFSNRPRLSFDNGYHSNGHPKGHHHVKSSVSGSASVVGVPMSRSSGFTSEIGDLISRLHPPTISSSSSANKQSFPPSVITQPLPPPPPSTLSGSVQGPTKAKSDIVCWSPSSSFLAKWQGPRSNPPPLPPLPTRKELMSTGRQQPTVVVGTPRRPQLTGKEITNIQQQDHNTNDNLTSGLRVKLSNRKLPPSPSNLHKPLVKSSSSIPGALDDRDDDQAEILSVCCGSEVMSTVSVPWSCYSKRTAPPFVSTISTTNTGPGDSHVHPLNSPSTGSSSCHRYHCHSHSQSHSHHHSNHRSHHNSKRSTSRSHHRSNNHCNRCWDVYFCDICDHCTSKSPPPPPLPSNRRRDEMVITRGEEKETEELTGRKEPLIGHLSIRSSSNSHHHPNLSRDHRNHHNHHHLNSSINIGNSSSLNKKDSSLHDETPSSNPGSIAIINTISGLNSSSNLTCYPRKPGSTVSSNGVERRRRRRRKSSQCKNRSSQGSTGHHHHHHHGPCKHLPRSTSVTEYRSCRHCYNDKHQQHYSSSE